MKWLIYKHTCLISGKSYIGQTKQTNPNQRWRSGKGYKPKTDTYTSLIWNAIQKYGGIETWDTNWTHEILEDNIQTLEEANQREIYWISFFHTWVHDQFSNGYNITTGGGGNRCSRLMTKDNVTIKVPASLIDDYLVNGWLLHDSKQYRPIKQKLWYETHKLEQNERTKKYYHANKEKFREINKNNCKKLYATEEYREHKKAYRKAHPEVDAKAAANYKAKHKDDPEYKRKHAEANKRWLEKKKQQAKNC